MVLIHASLTFSRRVNQPSETRTRTSHSLHECLYLSGRSKEGFALAWQAFLLCHFWDEPRLHLEAASPRQLLQLGATIEIFSSDEWILVFFLLWGKISKVSE